MKTLLITALAAVFALQVQGQDILQKVLYSQTPINENRFFIIEDNSDIESIINVLCNYA